MSSLPPYAADVDDLATQFLHSDLNSTARPATTSVGPVLRGRLRSGSSVSMLPHHNQAHRRAWQRRNGRRRSGGSRATGVQRIGPMRVQQDLQVALRDRYRRCLTQDFRNLAHETRMVSNWMRNQPALAAITSRPTPPSAPCPPLSRGPARLACPGRRSAPSSVCHVRAQQRFWRIPS